MSTDYRAELQLLVKAYDEHGGKWPDHHEQALFQAVEDARAALAQPEPVAPTLDCDEIDVPVWHRGDDFHVYKEGYTAGWAAGAKAAADCYARPAIQPEPALSPAEVLMQAMEGTLPKCCDCCHFRPGPNIGAGQGLCSHDSIGGSNLHGPSDWCRNWLQSEKTITTETP